jgi:hypothetical protein
VAQPDPDGAVGEAHAVAALDVGTFRLDRAVTQAEAQREDAGVGVDPREQLVRALPIQIQAPAAGCRDRSGRASGVC